MKVSISFYVRVYIYVKKFMSFKKKLFHINRYVLDWIIEQGTFLFIQASKFFAALGNNFIKEVNSMHVFSTASQVSTKKMIILHGLLTY